MSLAALLKGLAAVRAAVLGDTEGNARETLGEVDGDLVAASTAVTARALSDLGGRFKLGGLRRVSVKGPRSSELVAVREGAILAIGLEPGRPTAEVEARLVQSDFVSGRPELLKQLVRTLEAIEPKPEEVALDLALLKDTLEGRMPLEPVRAFFRLREMPPDPATVRELEGLVESHPDRFQMRETLARALLQLGECRRAAAHFRELAEADLPSEMMDRVLLGLGCAASKELGDQQPGARLHAAVSSAPRAASAANVLPPVSDARPASRQARPVSLDPSPALGGNNMGFTGSLQVVTLPDLLEFLRCSRRTGALLLTSKSQIGAIYLRQGKIIGAAAPRCPSLGNFLRREGSISGQLLELALQRHRANGSLQPLGAYLVGRGLVDGEAVRAALTHQILEALQELLCWTSGQFAFEPDAAGQSSAAEIEVELDPQYVLLELYRAQDEKQRLA